MDNRNEISSAPAGVANYRAAFDALPIEILLEVVPHTDVVSAIQMTQVSDFDVILVTRNENWTFAGLYIAGGLLDLQGSTHASRELVKGSALDDVRQAAVTAHKLHIKWSVRLDATPARSYALAPRLATEAGGFKDLLSWTLVLDDGVHVMHSDIDDRVKLRRVDTGEVVWESHLKSGALGCLDYGFYEDNVILIFDVPDNKSSFLRQMVIWRYKGPGNCNPVYSLDIANPLGHMWATRVNFIRGVYVGCLVYSRRGTLTAYISNWLTGTHVSFDVSVPGDDESFSTFTETELLIGFQRTDHATIHMYSLKDLARHMVKTIPNVIPTIIPLSPNTTYRVDFQGKDVESYRDLPLEWRPHFQEVANGQIGFFGRTKSNSILPLVMVSTLAWPPTHGSQASDQNVTVKAQATFFTQVNINRSRFGQELWTLGTAKKTIGILAINVVGDRTALVRGYRPVIKLFDIKSGDIHGETAMDGEGKESAMGELLWTSYPQWLQEHGQPVSLDMDDARGRMVLSMSDGTLAVIEFV